MHAHELRSFQQAHRIEAQGVAEELAPIVLEVFERLTPVPDDEGVSSGGPGQLPMSVAINALLHSLLKDPERDRMPSLQIEAALHASLRWDKKRQVDANDLFDFRHASAALAYCDLFFTEGPLRSMIEQRHITLDKRFDCTVRSTLDGALDALKELGKA